MRGGATSVAAGLGAAWYDVPVLTQYLAAAMNRATFEFLDEDALYYGEIPGLDGVYATGATLEACRAELAQVVDGWILLGVSLHHELPDIDGVRLRVPA